MEKEILSIGRESVVYKEDGLVYKCYNPERRANGAYLELFGREDCVHLSTYDSERRRHFFKIEAAILSALSEINPRIVPEYIDSDGRTLNIRMEYIGHPTFEEVMLKPGSDPDILTEQMVQILATYHSVCNEHLKTIKVASRNKKRKNRIGLKTRNRNEEVGRWLNYFQAIIYYESTDFEDYLTDRGINHQDLNPKKIRTQVSRFLDTRGIDLKTEVEEIIERDLNLTNNEASFVWAEAKPQNIFYIPTEEKIRVIDFPRVRLGPGSDIDLVNIIYNVYRSQFKPGEEKRSIMMGNEYFAGIGLSPKEFPGRHSRLLAARIKESLRLYANYCQKNPYEIRKLVGRREESDLKDDGELKERFLENRFNCMFQDFFEHYRYRGGEGWETLMEGPLAPDFKTKRLVKQQLESIEDVLKVSGVLRGQFGERKKRRIRRLRKIIAPNDF